MYITTTELRRQYTAQCLNGKLPHKLRLTFCEVDVIVKFTRAMKALLSSSSNTCGGGCGTTVAGIMLDKHHPTWPGNKPNNGRKLVPITMIVGESPHGGRVIMNADHIVPQGHGGKHGSNNLQIMCKVCNEAKGNRYPSEVILSRKWWKKLTLIEKSEKTVYDL